MKQLTEELFRYSLLSTAQPLERADVMLNQVLEESLFGPPWGPNPAEHCSGPGPDHCTSAARQLDQGALSRVFANILSNVLKYSEGDLAVRLTSEGEITFSNAASGLTPVMAGRLFDRFYTVESGRHATGLGLTIAKHLTEAMGGRIRADCRGGRLTIALSFPAEPSKREGASCSTPYFCDTNVKNTLEEACAMYQLSNFIDNDDIRTLARWDPFKLLNTSGTSVSARTAPRPLILAALCMCAGGRSSVI